jgi:hypothetical protein
MGFMTSPKSVKFIAKLTEVESGTPGAHLLVMVTVEAPGLDRSDLYGWTLSLKHRKLGERLVRAVEAGVVFTPERIDRDVNGKTFLVAPTKVFGRTLNADLKRLGF